MNRSARLLPILLGCCCLFNTGCMAAKLNRTEITANENKAAINEMRLLLADNTAALDEIRNEIRRLNGQVDELQEVAVGKTQDLERTLQRFGKRVPPPPGIPEDLLLDDEEKIGKIEGPDAELYRSGLYKIRTGDFEAAREAFFNFVQTNSDTAFTDNALFWLGMSFEKLGSYDRAVVAYSDVFRRFPAEDRAPISMYRLAEVFAKSGSREEALFAYQKLVEDHPKSNEARLAKTKLKELTNKKHRRKTR